jgi:hypothetical protein
MQFGAREGQPLLETSTLNLVDGSERGLRISIGNVLENRWIFAQHRTVFTAQQRD